jgi:hypothetical protein
MAALVGVRSNSAPAETRSVLDMVVDVADVLSGRLPLCLECLMQRTSLRVDEVLRELDALPALGFAEGRCMSSRH